MTFSLPPLPSFDNPYADDAGSPHTRMTFKAIEAPSHSLHFDFNPTDFKLTRSVKWDNKTAMRSTYGILDFQNGESDKLAFTVLLDATEGKCMGHTDVSKAIKELYEMTQPWVGQGTEQQRPPLCQLTWADFSFTGVITKLDFNYLVFGEAGSPLRAEVTMELTGRAFAQITKADFFKAEEAPTRPS